jgi:hypothetical protein
VEDLIGFLRKHDYTLFGLYDLFYPETSRFRRRMGFSQGRNSGVGAGAANERR